jgi:TRAP-type C4-dicarboxylate transport system substrate-binding protein
LSYEEEIMDRKWLICVLLIAIVIVAPMFTGAKAVAKPIKLVWGSHWPPHLAPYQVIERWFKKLENMSNGQLEFKIYPGATLSAIDTALYDLQAGSTDFQTVSAHIFTAEFPITHAMQYFWYDYRDLPLASTVFWKTYDHFPEIQAEFAAAEVRPFCLIVPGALQLHSRKAVRRLSDLKGMEIGIGGAYLLPVFEKFGASPSDIIYMEFYTSLQKNIIDACTFNNEFLKAMKLGEVTKYTTGLGGSYDASGSTLCIREEAWKSLPPNIQKLLNENTEDLRQDYFRSIKAVNEVGKKFALDLGHEFIEFPSEDIKKWYTVCEEVARSGAAELDKKGYPGTKIFEYTRKVKAELE